MNLRHEPGLLLEAQFWNLNFPKKEYFESGNILMHKELRIFWQKFTVPVGVHYFYKAYVRHGDTAAVPNYVLNNIICTLSDYDVWLGRYVA